MMNITNYLGILRRNHIDKQYTSVIYLQVHNLSVLKSGTKQTKINLRKESKEFLSVLINHKPNKLEKLVHELAKKNNPKLLSIIKVEDLFKTSIEFDSRSQLLRKLNGSMKASVLNTIIARLVSENKLVVNDDHSLTWIDTKANTTLNKHFKKAVSI